MKSMRRLIALLLVFVMIVGTMPMALAIDETGDEAYVADPVLDDNGGTVENGPEPDAEQNGEISDADTVDGGDAADDDIVIDEEPAEEGGEEGSGEEPVENEIPEEVPEEIVDGDAEEAAGLDEAMAIGIDGLDGADDGIVYVANSAAGGSNESGDGSRERPYMTITAAMSADNYNGIISLLSDIEISNTLVFDGRDAVVMGNNFSIVYKGDDVGIESGAISVTGGSDVTFTDITLTRQKGLSYKGRVLYVRDASVTLDRTNVENGWLAASNTLNGGSAIYVANYGSVTLLNNTNIDNNRCDSSDSTSGAIFVAKGGALEIHGAAIYGNKAVAGAGIYVEAGGTMDIYSVGESINISDEIYIAVDADASVGADRGESGNIVLDRVVLESDVTANAKIARLDISGETTGASIGIEIDIDSYHYEYRLIAAEADGYGIETMAGIMDEDGWTDICGKWDIRYMVYDGVPGLYFYYHTLGAAFSDVDTLTGITGTDINGESVSYYNTEDVLNTTVSNGVLTIPEIIASDSGDFEFDFTVDEANKDYRIPTPDVIELTLNGKLLANGQDYEYTPDYENGTAHIKVFAKTVTGKSGSLSFRISGEKYSLLTLAMNGPVYTMATDITGQSVKHAMAVAKVTANKGSDVTYVVTRDGFGAPGVEVVLYREGTDETVASRTTDGNGYAVFTGLNKDYSYYFVLYYSDSFYVIERDKVDVSLATLEGQKMSERCEYESADVKVDYNVTDSESFSTGTSLVTGTVADTTVTYFVDLAHDTIVFIANQGEATTADTATFHYTGADYRADDFSKVMETNATTYGNMPSIEMVGYTFMGWYDAPEGGNKITSATEYYTASSPKTLWAHWTPHNVEYTVEHWVELAEPGVNPGYVRGTTETKEAEGKTYYLWQTDLYEDEPADSIMPSVLHLALQNMNVEKPDWWTLDGFTIVPDMSCKVMADGSAVFGCYYDRNRYTITFDPTEGDMTSLRNTLFAKYGAEIGAMLVAVRPGYLPGGWWFVKDDGSEQAVTSTSYYEWLDNITVEARWIRYTTTYTIKVMTEDKSYDAKGQAYADGTYTQFKTVTTTDQGLPLPATSDTEMTVDINTLSALSFDGFTYEGYNFTGDELGTDMVKADKDYTVTPNEFGTTVIYLYYSRNEVKVTFRDDNTPGAGVHDETVITWGDEFDNVFPETDPVKPGYDFAGWVDDHGNAIEGGTETNVYTADGDGEMNVYPAWSVREYFLTYVPGEGSDFDVTPAGASGYAVNSEVSGGYIVPVSLAYDRQIGTMPLAAKTGYEFLGWQLHEGPAAGQYMVPGTVLTVDNAVIKNDDNSYEATRPLYAEYEPYHFTLVLDPGNGTVNPSALGVSYMEDIPELPVPVLTGYTFVGWMLDTGDSAGTRLVSGEPWTYLTSNGATVTAHAMYYANRYSYTLDLNDVYKGNGSTVASLYDQSISNVEIAFDSEYALVLDGLVAQRNGYYFLGWSTTLDKADLVGKTAVNKLADDATLHAIWQPMTYELQIDVSGGDLPSTDSYSWNRYAAQYYEEYERQYGGGDMAAHRDANGIWHVPVIFDTVYGELDQLVRDGYKFEGYRVSAPGWYDGDISVLDGKLINSIDIGYTDSVDSAISLKAVWTPYFDFVIERNDAAFEDGTTGTKRILRTDIAAEGKLPVAVCEGYTFIGWYDDVAGKYADLAHLLSCDEHRVLRAVFTPNVTFIANGGKVIVDGEKYDIYTIGLSILAEKYGKFFMGEHDTMTFMGWLSADGTDLTVFANILNRVTPITLTASWDVTVTFDISDGAYWPDGDRNDKVFPASLVGEWETLPEVYLDGYSFLYWFDDDGNQVRPADLSAITHSVTVHSAFTDGPTVSRINVKVTNYATAAPLAAEYTEPAGGWIKGSNVLKVKCNSACGVALVRNGEMTELQCAKNGDYYDYVIDALDGDEVIIVLKGDVDMDGAITLTDASIINRYLTNQCDFNNAQLIAGDVGLNGTVDLTDVSGVNGYLTNVSVFPWNII